MSNKERLEQNNVKIQQLIDLVQTKQSGNNTALIGLIQRDITTLEIPYGITAIGSYAFYQYYKLTNITIPESVTSIGIYAFSGCSGLTSVTIGKGVTSIGQGAFHSCSGLTSVTIPESVTSIGIYAFSGCSKLETVYYGGTIEGWCNINFANLRTNGGIYRYLYINNELLKDITTSSSIKDYSFSLFKCIESVNLLDGATMIGQYSFYECYNLTSVNIPSSVTSIRSNAFDSCSKLTEMTILATTPPTLSSTSAISAVTTTIYIPAGTLEAYSTATNWSSFADKFVELSA